MRLALCIITKGDEEIASLSKLLTSVDGVFDSVHITTNGNAVQKTKELCERFGLDYSHLPWDDDFSKQRNYNFSRVPEGTDFIVWADSDDVILEPKRLRDIAKVSKKNGYDVVFFDYWYGAEFDGEPSIETFVQPELTQSRERLIRPGSIVWKKRIHETPVPIDPQSYVYTRIRYSKEYPTVWLHLGADRDLPEEKLLARNERNRRLLELELQEERAAGGADPRTLLYLMKVYADMGDHVSECIDMGKEYLEKSGWDQERAVCYRIMSQCYGDAGEHAKAKALLHKAIEEYPYDALLYLYLARAYFNLKNYGAMKHWLQIGLNIDIAEKTGDMNNLLELKVLAPQLMLMYYLNADRNIRKAWEASKTLVNVLPTKENLQNEEYLFNQKELDIACEHLHKIINYYESINRQDLIPGLIDASVEEIKRLPFAHTLHNKYREPKIWQDNEICYYATFGGEHFEKWDAGSIEKGIGGSETAVIELSKEWTKLGYSVTVYGDPNTPGIDEHGINWQPYYTFNIRDSFNIFIQWRNNSLAGKVKANKYLVDLHDMYIEDTYKDKIGSTDKLMVKSIYHRDLAPDIPEDKFAVVSNGIKTT